MNQGLHNPVPVLVLVVEALMVLEAGTTGTHATILTVLKSSPQHRMLHASNAKNREPSFATQQPAAEGPDATKIKGCRSGSRARERCRTFAASLPGLQLFPPRSTTRA